MLSIFEELRHELDLAQVLLLILASIGVS